MKTGLVSVVMAVHNEQEDFLRVSFNSIFQQSYSNIELIVIDDASDEVCQGVINDLCKDKINVKRIRNVENLGLTKSLNRGLAMTEGEFVARMDADDISMPKRIELQVDFLKNHSDIDIVGTGVVAFGEENCFMSPAFGYTNDEAQCNLFFSSTLCHPSVMMRKSFLDKNRLSYDENVKKGQDYDLWERASVHGKLAVMSNVLLFYRTHSKQITYTNRFDQNSSADTIRKRRLQRIGINASDKDYKCHKLLASGTDRTISVNDVESWINVVLGHNDVAGFVDGNALKKNLKERFLLYKLRNHQLLKAFMLKDVALLVKIVVLRMKMSIKLYKTNKELRHILGE